MCKVTLKRSTVWKCDQKLTQKDPNLISILHRFIRLIGLDRPQDIHFYKCIPTDAGNT